MYVPYGKEAMEIPQFLHLTDTPPVREAKNLSQG